MPDAAPSGVRIPLQLGNSAVLGRLRASALFLPSLVLLFAWIVIPGWLGGAFGDIVGTLGMVPGLAVGVVAIVGMAFAMEGAEDARRQAPSDLVLGGAGVTVEGGPHDGVRIPWSELGTAVVAKNERNEAGAVLRFLAAILRFLRLSALARRLHADAHELRVGKRVLGSAVAAAEIDSLRLLAQTLVALAEQRTAGTDEAPAPTSPDVISCAACGGAAVPADAAEVTCRFCGAAVSMPGELRERLRAHAQVKGAARLERAIARLLDQPGATIAGKWMARGVAIMRLGWPLGLVVLATLSILHALEEDALPRIVLSEPATSPFLHDLALAGAVAFVCFAGIAVGLDAYFANRRALRLVTLDFGASPPPRAGAGWGCRVCAGPLPDGDRILVRCVYCDAENVLGIDLRVQGRRKEAQAKSVGEALHHRRRARIRLAIVLVLLAAGAGALGHELHYTALATRPRPEHDFGCFGCRLVRLENHDGVRHRLRVVAETGERTRVVRAHGAVDVECQYDCELRLGSQSYAITRSGRLVVEGGWLLLDDARR